MGTPEERITTVITLGDDEFVKKLAAMRAHATQMPADSPWSRATPAQLRQFMGTEMLELVPAPISDQDYSVPEDDIFAGL